VALLSHLDHDLPTNPKALSQALNKLLETLSQAGLHITRSRTANQRMITITLTNADPPTESPESAPPDVPTDQLRTTTAQLTSQLIPIRTPGLPGLENSSNNHDQDSQ